MKIGYSHLKALRIQIIKVPGYISSLCDELLDATNSFGDASDLESCMQWYNKFYGRDVDLQFVERVRQLETDILYCNFSSRKMAELTNWFGEANSGSSEKGLVEPQPSAMMITDEDGASMSPKVVNKSVIISSLTIGWFTL
ncbi:hypothetical protein C1646_664841 [Rhizophagus diaphanus]|nr:hypothetical protein C1646_664841 [Rhizophagus diaphanus] [Rhizophagus sp. MUCL 43196]